MQKQGRGTRKLQSNVVRTFARRLRDTRREHGLSQMKLAIKAGIHISYLGRLERGESTPSIDTVAQIAIAMGIDAPELLKPEHSAEPRIQGLRAQVRENVDAVLKKSDQVALQALAVVSAALARAR